jgi:hypothetical protein
MCFIVHFIKQLNSFHDTCVTNWSKNVEFSDSLLATDGIIKLSTTLSFVTYYLLCEIPNLTHKTNQNIFIHIIKHLVMTTEKLMLGLIISHETLTNVEILIRKAVAFPLAPGFSLFYSLHFILFVTFPLLLLRKSLNRRDMGSETSKQSCSFNQGRWHNKSRWVLIQL